MEYKVHPDSLKTKARKVNIQYLVISFEMILGNSLAVILKHYDVIMVEKNLKKFYIYEINR